MKKVLSLIMLGLFLATGLNFSLAQQQEPAPYIRLLGTQWDKCGIGAGKIYKDIGIEMGIIFLRDRNNQLGIMKLLIIAKKDKVIPIAGWLNPFTPAEKGFILKTGLETKTREEHEALVYMVEKNKNGDPVLVIIHVETKKKELLSTSSINLKEFAEQYFTEKSPPNKR